MRRRLWRFGVVAVVTLMAGLSFSHAGSADVCWTWGRNGYGQLGDGTTSNRNVRWQVLGLGEVVAIAGGGYHSLALMQDGTVWAWGRNEDGQLGDGTTTDRASPVQVTGLTGVVAIAAGAYHSLALMQNGTVRAWGRNGDSQLGDGTTTNRSTPVQVPGLTGVTAIASGGGNHNLALTQDGRVWAWGHNLWGQLGDGTTANRSAPVQTQSLTTVEAIATGGGHSLALRQNGTVWAWGANWYGQLGDGTTTYPRTNPVQVQGLTQAIAIAGGGNHSLALRQDGTARAWGGNYRGQLGDGTTVHPRLTPLQVQGLTGVSAIAGGGDHSLAVKQDGTAWTWGWNAYGQLGDGSTTNRLAPVRVTRLTEVTATAGGAEHSLALSRAPVVGFRHLGAVAVIVLAAGSIILNRLTHEKPLRKRETAATS